MDLPEPLGPTSARLPPAGTEKLDVVEDRPARGLVAEGDAADLDGQARRERTGCRRSQDSTGSSTGGGASTTSNRRPAAAWLAPSSWIDCDSGWTASNTAMAASGSSAR